MTKAETKKLIKQSLANIKDYFADTFFEDKIDRSEECNLKLKEAITKLRQNLLLKKGENND